MQFARVQAFGDALEDPAFACRVVPRRSARPADMRTDPFLLLDQLELQMCKLVDS
jgi:hypothetical protein